MMGKQYGKIQYPQELCEWVWKSKIIVTGKSIEKCFWYEN